MSDDYQEPPQDPLPNEEHWRKVEVSIWARTYGNREQAAQFAHDIVKEARTRLLDAVLDARIVIFPPEQSAAIAPKD